MATEAAGGARWESAATADLCGGAADEGAAAESARDGNGRAVAVCRAGRETGAEGGELAAGGEGFGVDVDSGELGASTACLGDAGGSGSRRGNNGRGDGDGSEGAGASSSLRILEGSSTTGAGVISGRRPRAAMAALLALRPRRGRAVAAGCEVDASGAGGSGAATLAAKYPPTSRGAVRRGRSVGIPPPRVRLGGAETSRSLASVSAMSGKMRSAEGSGDDWTAGSPEPPTPARTPAITVRPPASSAAGRPRHAATTMRRNSAHTPSPAG